MPHQLQAIGSCLKRHDLWEGRRGVFFFFLFRPKDTPGEGEGLVSCRSPWWQGSQDGGGHAVVWEGLGRLRLLTDKASDRKPKKNPSYTVFVQTEPLPARCLGFNLTTQGDTAGLQAVERQQSPAKPRLALQTDPSASGGPGPQRR